LVLAGCAAPSVNNDFATVVTPTEKAGTAPAKDVPITPVAPAQSPAITGAGESVAAKVVWPITNADQRITKKPFGLKVSPQNSPVQPEKFSGYHTGVDFETFPDEQNIDVSIAAICDGKILVRRRASGYGGVLVESCQLDSAPVTVVYGHLRLASVTKKVGDQLKAGENFAVLGTGYSSETDGERKHLHLVIHKGSSVNILGYVQTQSALGDWIDFQKYMNGLKN
jgi:hypothetical protein